MEVWKDVQGYEGLYKVSNLGKVKRLFKSGKENVLSGRADKDGYIEVILSKNQKKKTCRLHRLVALAFIPNPNGKKEVNHKDKNKQNNSVDNLEWVTTAENIRHSFAMGRNMYKRAIVQYTKAMEIVAHWESIREASRNLKIATSGIVGCCGGHLQTSGGFIWRYEGGDI